MQPLSFGSDQRRLFGILSARPAGAPAKLGVILCNAFGREAIRAHRFSRVLAERLSRAGCDVLRFDYFGTGDSAGDDHEVNLAGFEQDLRSAHEELIRRTGAVRIAWMGMRVGACVIESAARSPPAGLARVVLWDPIADGRDYLDLLRRRHIESLSPEHRKAGVTPIFRDQPAAYIDEAIGFPLPREFFDQLRAWRFSTAGLAAIDAQVVCEAATQQGREVAALCRAHTPALQVVEIDHGTDWTSDDDSSGLVPAPVMNLLTARIQGLS